jgi:hypothetical protein
MLDEAEYQMFTSLDKTKNMERSNAEKMIENLKLQHEAEIASLQMSLNKMILVNLYTKKKINNKKHKLYIQVGKEISRRQSCWRAKKARISKRDSKYY